MTLTELLFKNVERISLGRSRMIQIKKLQSIKRMKDMGEGISRGK